MLPCLLTISGTGPILGILLVISLTMALFLFGKARAAKGFSSEIEELLSNCEVPSKRFGYEQLAGLPDPVARYFRHVLKEGQPYIASAKVTHNGLFKTNLKKKWKKIEGEQYFTASPPGFVWKGVTDFFSARDMYVGKKGRLVVLLLSIIPIIDANGATYNEAELQRWLAECIWFPTNLLPSKLVSWHPIDSNNATLLFRYEGISITLLVTVNDIGEITKFETTRFITKEKREKWIGTLSDYQELNGILIPRIIEVKWVLGSEVYPYARFHVKTIEYDNASCG